MLTDYFESRGPNGPDLLRGVSGGGTDTPGGRALH